MLDPLKISGRPYISELPNPNRNTQCMVYLPTFGYLEDHPMACKWLITMVSKSPNWGCSPSQWPKCLINGGYSLLTKWDDTPSSLGGVNVAKYTRPIDWTCLRQIDLVIEWIGGSVESCFIGFTDPHLKKNQPILIFRVCTNNYSSWWLNQPI